MQDFARVLRQAAAQRRAVVACLLCSIGISVLWGANIGALYPFVEVVFYGQSPVEYVEAEIARGEAEITRLEAQLAGVDTSDTRAADALRARIDAERSGIRRAREWRPFVEQHLPSRALPTVTLVVALLFGITLLRAGLIALNDLLVARVAHRTLYDLRKRVYQHALEMDLAAFDADRASRITSHITHDVRIIGEGIRAVLGVAVKEPLKLLACLFGAAFISWRLTLLALVIAPIAALAWRRMYRATNTNVHQNLAAMSELHGQLAESFAGMRIVKAFTMEPAERRRFHRVSSTMLRRLLRLSAIRATLKPFVEAVGVGVVCLALLAGAYLVINQETHLLGIPISSRPLRPASMLLFYAFLIGMSDPARKLSGIAITLQHSAAASERVYRFLGRAPRVADPVKPAEPLPKDWGIRFEQVTFRYGKGEPALRRIDLDVAPGECVAIVGENGSGKSTLLDMVLRFQDPQRGAVRVGGVDLRDLRLRDLRGRIGLVAQSTTLFDESVEKNIWRARPSASQQDVRDAALLTGADRFIREDLPDGYDTVVGSGGVAISGGQAQRIAVARALLRDPKILLLDEATSSMDVAAERELVRVLASFIPGRTTLVVTHRPALLALASRIALMREGRVVDVGSHAELLERSPLYARLRASWNAKPDRTP